MTYDELREEVKRHCWLYYDKATPELSDKDYDALYESLENVEKSQGWVAHDSPTIKVGGLPGKVSQPIKLYSLKKVYDIAEVDPSFNIKTPKVDGTNITLVYKRGKLVLMLTRGNGETGDNVIHLSKGISNIPTTITTDYDRVVVNGECVTNNDVDNFRNYVSGALGLKSLNDFLERNIKFIAHDLLGVELNYTTRMKITKSMGFTTVFDDISKYPTDGVVYRIDDYKKCVNLGYTSKYPKFAVALKPREVETAITTLLAVEWSIGRTGTVNPTGIIEPVVLEDATISRVTLHNMGIIEEHNLGLGDSIEIERAGGVIPKFLRVIKHSAHNAKITEKDAEKAINTQVIRSGPKLLILDKTQANLSKGLEHFVKIMEIKGLGPANIEKMNLQSPTELFKVNSWEKLGANGSKIVEELERSKTRPYETVLAALGIPSVGKSTAKLIVSKLPKFSRLKEIEYTEIKGIGPATVKAILSWLEDNEQWVYKLPLQLEQEVSVNTILNKTKKVCITGKMDMSRTELADLLTSKGFLVTSTVTKDCYALITGGDDTSSKYKKAVTMGISIVDYWPNKKSVLNGNF